jgi:hypothetical protein
LGGKMKIKRFDISVEIFKELFNGKRHEFKVIANQLPEDAQLVRISVNPNESTIRTISAFYTSETFPDLPDGTLMESDKICLSVYFHRPDCVCFEQGE